MHLKNVHKNPVNFIAYLIGHEGKNTLYDILTEFGYILNLNCNVSDEIGNKAIFTIDVLLSDVGEKNQNDVINIIFMYIDLIKKSFLTSSDHLKNLYEEQKMLNNYNFEFIEQQNPETKCMKYYETLSSCDVQLKYLLIINYLMDTFDNIKHNALCILDQISPKKTIVMYISKKYSDISKITDENYGTKYSMMNDDIKIKNVDNCKTLMLPEINKYLSLGKKIIDDTGEHQQKHKNGYLLKNTIFNNPNVNINLKIYLPLTIIDKYEYTKTLVYFTSILLNVGHEIYMCETAGYDVNFMFDVGTLNIEIEGNYEKIHQVCEFVVKSLKTPQFTKDEFDRTIYSLCQNDINLLFEAPYTRIANYFNKNTMLKFYTNLDRLDCYKILKYKDVLNVQNKLFTLGTFDLIISGNCDNILYDKLENILVKLMPDNIFVPTKLLEDSLITQVSDNIVQIQKENPDEKNNAVGTYLYISNISKFNNIKDKCILDVIYKLISQEYFFQLRTQEKFGYIVGSGIVLQQIYKSTNMYFRFIVQSQKNTSNEIIQRTKKFIVDFNSHLIKLDNNEFNEVLNACIKLASEPPINLESYSAKKMMELQYDLKLFNSSELIVKCYKSITIDEIKKFYVDKFINNNKIFICI